MPEHVDAPVGEIHIVHNYSYADATAREAATGFVSADVGKVALQLDAFSLWLLTDDSPATWQQIDRSGLASTNISDFGEAVEDKIGAKVIAGSGIGVSYNDGTGETTVTNTATGGLGGFGDVVGPGSSTDNALARFDSTTGKLIQDSSMTCADDLSGEIGYMDVPQNSQSAAYTTVLADRGKHIYHPVGDNNARTFTIDSNANVPYRIGTAITFINDKNTVTIAITSDTLVWAEDGSTGSRTLAENGVATAIKVTSTRWIISGTGLS
jgi:hypothetical protein